MKKKNKKKEERLSISLLDIKRRVITRNFLNTQSIKKSLLNNQIQIGKQATLVPLIILVCLITFECGNIMNDYSAMGNTPSIHMYSGGGEK